MPPITDDLLKLITVLASIVAALAGTYKIMMAYQDRRETAKELEHARTLELQAAELKRATAEQERADTQLQKAIDGMAMLANELGRVSANQAKLIDAMLAGQEQEKARIELQKQSLTQTRDDSREIKQNVKDLGGSLGDRIGRIAESNRQSYQEALDKKVDEEHDLSAKLIAELKAKLEKLEGYVEKDMLPLLKELHQSIDSLATKDDIAPVKDMAGKLSILEARIAALMAKSPADGAPEPKTVSPPAPPPATAIIDSKPNEAVKPPEENKSETTS